MIKKSPSNSSLGAIELEEGSRENLSADMNMKVDPSKPSIQGAARVVKRERAFELSLPALVTGVDALENKFKEKTFLLTISSEEATIWLRSRVAIGSRLDLSLEIPKTLILENHLKLQLSGTVSFFQSDSSKNGKKQVVSIRLDKKFRLLPLPSNNN